VNFSRATFDLILPRQRFDFGKRIGVPFCFTMSSAALGAGFTEVQFPSFSAVQHIHQQVPIGALRKKFHEVQEVH
jgi:hypothetical protein